MELNTLLDRHLSQHPVSAPPLPVLLLLPPSRLTDATAISTATPVPAATTAG